jgi:uncharacterized membrane-anchored protein
MSAAAAAGLAAEHPMRRALAHEVHARPADEVPTPARATFVAVLVNAADRASEHAHVVELCRALGVEPPSPTVTHFSAHSGELTVKWERHGEFSGYTFTAPGLSPVPFSEPPTRLLPVGWLGAMPGRTIVAAHAKVVAAPSDAIDAEFLSRHFGEHIVVGGDVGERSGSAYTDFRIHADGFSRFLVVDRGFTPRQTGRMLQRLFEIEAYRTMALLALPMARQQAVQLDVIEATLVDVTSAIAADGGDDEALLGRLTRLAAEVEGTLAAGQFRYNACRAYSGLVTMRITELRETRIAGVQPIGEFMARRFAPGVSTCATVSQRLHDLSQRVARASSLLSTRVDIARERQNIALLASMDRRAKMQLRLQETVEGLSVAAIVYYAAGLVTYVAKAVRSIDSRVDPDAIAGWSVPLLVVLVIAATRYARRRARR